MPRAASGMQSEAKLQWSVNLYSRTESPFTMVTASERSVLTPSDTSKRLPALQIPIGVETSNVSLREEKCKRAAMIEIFLIMAVFHSQPLWR